MIGVTGLLSLVAVFGCACLLGDHTHMLASDLAALPCETRQVELVDHACDMDTMRDLSPIPTGTFRDP